MQTTRTPTLPYVSRFSPLERKEYCSPKLLRFGTIAALTNSGTGANTEQVTSSDPDHPCSSDKHRRSCAPSEPRLKQNILRIGSHPIGIGLYLFGYKPEYQATWGYGRQFGVMADEVEAAMPEAIHLHPDGYRLVDYAMLGIDRS